jgi:class 3 adenylate cyclase/tetratricopeptide (TPR) repeat protein
MNDLPSGTVTFLFTDIEGSTPLYQNFPEAMPRAMTRHREILHHAIQTHHGIVFNIIGDAFCAAFANAMDALRAALNAQRALHAEHWREIGTLRVRMGLHTGTAEARDDDYISSLTLVRVQRIMSAGHGGQTLLSSATAELVQTQLPSNITLRELGIFKLRGLQQPEPLYQIVTPDLPSEFPALRAVETTQIQNELTPLEQLVRGKMVGRGNEFAQLQQQWNLAQQGRAHLVLLSGEPGVGKTRLAKEVMEYAQSSGAPILRGGCYEYEATTPYLPFVEALRDWVHASSAENLRATLGDTAPEIAKLAPEIETKLGALPPNPILSPNEERLRLFDNVARFLQTLAAPRGLLILLDDLHWADQGTINLLHYLLRHLRTDRVLLLGAYREVELDRAHPLADALIEWNRERLATRVSLARLSRADTGALVAALFGQETISDEFVRVLYRETEGNPFFIEEVVKSLIEQGQIYRENNAWQRKAIDDLAIPQSVKEAIGRRLNRLTENCVDALRTAAALGKIFPFVELRAVATTSEDDLLDALDEASAAQLLRAEQNDTFAFTHDKIREVLYEELNPIRRRRLHQRIGEGLEKLYPSPNGHSADLAYHFTQSGDAEKSLMYSVRAAENAERVFAHDDALKFYQQARDAAETLQRNDALAHIDERIGDIYLVRGDIAPSVASYERARAIVADASHRAALNVKIGRAYSPIGDARGIHALETALTELNPQTQPAEYASALALIGRHHHYHTHHKKALDYFEQARAIAEPLDDSQTLQNIYAFLAGSYQHTLEYDVSDEWARRSIALGERKNDPEAVALGYEFLSENAFNRGEWDDAIRYANHNRDIGLKISSLARVSWADFALAAGLLGKGELREAERVSIEGLEIAEQLGERRVAIWLASQLARVLAELGDDDRARKFAEQGITRSQALGQIVLRVWALQGLGFVHWRRGEFVQAANSYQQGLDVLQGSENRVALNSIAPHAAQAFFNAGRIAQAETLAQQALELATFGRTPQAAALAQDVLGQVCCVQEKWDDAQRALDESIATFEKLSSRLDLARALEHRAALYRARNEIERAKIDEARARALYEETGAKK